MVLHGSFNNAFLVGGMKIKLQFQKQTSSCVYHMPPSVETGCWPRSSTISDRRCSGANMFRSFDMPIPMNSLLSRSMATQSHIDSEPILITVSSITCSETFFFFDDNF